MQCCFKSGRTQLQPHHETLLLGSKLPIGTYLGREVVLRIVVRGACQMSSERCIIPSCRAGQLGWRGQLLEES